MFTFYISERKGKADPHVFFGQEIYFGRFPFEGYDGTIRALPISFCCGPEGRPYIFCHLGRHLVLGVSVQLIVGRSVRNDFITIGRSVRHGHTIFGLYYTTVSRNTRDFHYTFHLHCFIMTTVININLHEGDFWISGHYNCISVANLRNGVSFQVAYYGKGNYTHGCTYTRHRERCA